MEDQEQKNHLSVLETQYHHQVHHCRKCGWPFPKPHPSAKHRRAHKRVCGSLEGYKLQDSSHTIVSDDDHSDDGDFKTPQISFKKRLERSPSEDDVYSDAVSNFADASLNSGVAIESASAVEKVSKAVVPEFGASAEGRPAGNLTIEAPMIAPTIADKSGKTPSDSSYLSSTIVAENQFDFSESASNVHESDVESLAESLTGGIKSPIENDATAEFSPNDNKVKVINDTPDAAESILQATEEVSAIADPNEGFALTVEMPNGKLVSPENFAVQESEGADSGDVVEHNGKPNEGVHLFHVPRDVPAVEHPEKFIQGFKKDHHPKKEDVGSDNFDLEVEHSQRVGEYNTIKEEELRKVNVLSVQQDVAVLVNQEKIIEGSKDYDNRDFGNAVEEKGEVSFPASDVLLDKDGLISYPIDQEVEVATDAVHKSQQLHEYDNLSDAMLDEDVTLSRGFDVKTAEEVISEEDDRSMNVPCVVPDSDAAGGEVGVIKEEEISDVKSLASVLSLNTGAPTGIPAFLSSVEIHQPIPISDGEANMKWSGEEEEVSGTVDTRTFLNLEDKERDNTISAVETSEFADNSSYSSPTPPVTEKLPRDVENGTKADGIGIVHVAAEDDSFRNEAAAAEDHSTVQSSLLDESAVRSSLDDSVVMMMEKREVAANETLTDGCLEAETTTILVVDEVLAEKEQLINKGSSSSMNEVGHDFDKEAALLPVGTVSQGVYEEASLHVEDIGTKQQQLTPSLLDSLSSPSESLDANWGSVSVLSTQSDTITPSDEPKMVGKPNTKQQQQTTAVETSFEESSLVVDSSSSFLTTTTTSEDNYSPGRKKKKEEMIAKVTNWTAQQNSSSPLKNLLVEANRDTKPISKVVVVEEEMKKKKDSSVKEDNGAAASSTVATSSTEPKAAAAAISEEWNSPARYPSEIKRDKKVKGRPYWAQFVCCSSGLN